MLICAIKILKFIIIIVIILYTSFLRPITKGFFGLMDTTEISTITGKKGKYSIKLPLFFKHYFS